MAAWQRGHVQRISVSREWDGHGRSVGRSVFFFFFFFFLEEEKTEICIQLYTGVQGLATEKMREYRKQ